MHLGGIPAQELVALGVFAFACLEVERRSRRALRAAGSGNLFSQQRQCRRLFLAGQLFQRRQLLGRGAHISWLRMRRNTPLSMLPPQKTMPTFFPARRSRSFGSAAKPIAPAPSTRFFATERMVRRASAVSASVTVTKSAS